MPAKGAATVNDAERLRELGHVTADAYQNFAQAIGLGTDNSLTTSTYGFNPITRVRTLLEWIYRGSWLGGVAIDIIADDMTRAGVEIHSTTPPEDIEKLQQAMTRHAVWGGINDTIKNARLYGGALGLMMIDGQDVASPLNIDRVGKEAFRGIMVFDRWMVEPDLNDLVTDLGPEIGLPKFYRVTTDAPAFRGKKLHHSRCIRLEGVRLPYWQRVMENLWGLSVFERLYDRMVAFDSATMGMAQLVYKAYIRTYKIKNYRKILGEGGDLERALMRSIEMMRRMQGNEGITLLDAEDDFSPAQQTTFTGIGDAVLQLAQQLSGALQIPLTRMLGQSPAGLNATGESDLRTYYDGIKHQQELTLRSGVAKILFILARSESVKLPDNFTFAFRDLWQMSESERSEVFSRDATSISGLEGSGIIAPKTALQELRGLSRATGRMTNITDDQIEAASDEPAPGPEELGLVGPDGQPVEPGGTEGSEDPGLSLKPGDKKKPTGDLAGAPIYADLPVVVEAKRGAVRWPGAAPLLADYGYIPGVASAEGRQEWMDVFLGPDQQSPDVWVADMLTFDGRFEEHKVMLGFNDERDARETFLRLYGETKLLELTHLSVGELHAWLDAKEFGVPLSGKRPPGAPAAANGAAR